MERKKLINISFSNKLESNFFHINFYRGNFSKVFKCLNENDKKFYAMKVINKRKLTKFKFQTKSSPYSMLETEMAILKKIDHPNVL